MSARSAAASPLLALALALGCVSVHKPVGRADTPAPETGYVAGYFARNEGTNFGFTLSNLATKREHVMAFGTNGSTLLRAEGDVTMVAVEPGDYRVTEWQVFASYSGEGLARLQGGKALPNDLRIGKPFRVEAGHVVHLGSFTGNTTLIPDSYGNIRRWLWSIRPQVISYGSAAETVARAHPAFAALPFACILCEAGSGPPRAGLATYDAARALKETAQGRAVAAHLAEFYAIKTKELEKAKARVEALKEARDAERNSAKRIALHAEVEAGTAHVRQITERLQGQIDAERDRATKRLLDRIEVVAEEYRKEEGLAEVAAKQVTVETGADVTDELIRRYDAKFPEAAPATAAPAPPATPPPARYPATATP